MARRKKKIEKSIIAEPTTIVVNEPAVVVNKPTIPIVLEKPIEPPGITMNEYLSNYSTKRGLDVVFIKWFRKKDPTNPKKSIQEWSELIDKFLNEVV